MSGIRLTVHMNNLNKNDEMQALRKVTFITSGHTAYTAKVARAVDETRHQPVVAIPQSKW